MLMAGEAVQSTFIVQKSKTVRASSDHNEFDLPGTSVGASQRRSGDNAGRDRAVKTTTGDSGTATASMMEVEEETYVTESGANIQPQSTTGLDYPSNQDMALQGAQTTQVGWRPRRHGLDTTATHGIISRLGDVDDDNMPGSGDDMPGFGRASLSDKYN